MMDYQVLRSSQDRSINIVIPSADGGAIETRYVRRTGDTVIIYLSSATGCDRACRFCHLTQTGQTMMTPVDVKGYLDQADHLLDMVDGEGRLYGATYVHFNFMARGDALLNPYFIGRGREIIHGLDQIAKRHGLIGKFKISTIFPQSNFFMHNEHAFKDWVQATLRFHPNIEFYYSLYSLDPSFRKRWIPKAVDPTIVGKAFSGTVGRLRLHHALIKDVNTDSKNIVQLGQWLQDHNIHSRFNIVRYNPFDERSGEEASEQTIAFWQQAMAKFDNVMASEVVSLVGKDVKASCGMFVELRDNKITLQ